MILKFIENDGVTGARLTMGERPIPDGSFLYRDGRYIRGGELGTIPAFATHRHAGETLQHIGVNSAGGAFAFDTTGAVTFNQNLISTGNITGNSFITASDIGIAADTDLLQLSADALLINGTSRTTAIGVGIAPDATTIGKLYRNDALTTPMVQIEQDGAGDASLTFGLTGGQFYTIGIDNSDSDRLKISPTAALANADYWNMLPTGQIGHGVAAVATMKYRILSTVADGGSANYGIYSEIDKTNTSVANYQLLGFQGVLRFRGTQGSTSAKGIRSFDALAFNYNTGTTTHFGGFYLDIRNLGAGTNTNLFGQWVIKMANSGGGTVTNLYGYKCDDQTIGTNNYGYYSGINVAAGRWNFYAAGTAANYFAGELQIDSDTYGVKFGAGQDSIIRDTGAYMLLDCDLNSVTGRYFQFDNGSLKIQEIASAPADTAGYGQLYCKDNAGTTELWFVDDSGTETQLA